MKTWLTISMLLLASMACSQTVTITGTVLDPAGKPYQSGSGVVSLVPGAVQWLFNNTNPVSSPVVIGGLDSFGHFSVSLTNTGLIQPQSFSPTWQFSFCSQTYYIQPLPVCFTMTPMALTSSQDISTAIQAQAAYLPLSLLSPITMETNGTLNTSQVLLNFTNANGCTWSNPTGGVEQIGCSIYALQVNGLGLAAGDTVNLNSTTPTAPANGVNLTVATSKSSTTDSVSLALVGDGNSGHYLNGGGTFTTPPGTYTLPTQYAKLRCETGLGDGLNEITSGTYLQSFCYNDSGVTWTITGIKCYVDGGSSSTLNAAGNTLGALLTGAVTCTSGFAAGNQSANVALTSGDYIKFTFVADGTAKQTTWVVSFTQ